MKIKTILIIVTLALFGCEKDVPTIEEPKGITPWTIHKEFTDLAKVKFTSISTSNFLYTYGPDFFSSIDINGKVSHAFNRLNHPSNSRLPISEAYYIEIDKNWIRFANTEWPVHNDRSAWIDLTKLNNEFLNVNTGTETLNRLSSIAINDINQCLIPIKTNNLGKEIVAYLFSIKNEDSYIKLTDTTRLNIPNPSIVNSQIIYLSKGIKDYFIISVDGGTFKVTSDGQIKKVLNTSFDNLFINQNILYGLKEPNLVYISSNEGQDWESFNNFPENLILANYTIIEDSIVGVKNSEIFTLRPTNGGFVTRNLINLGLENIQINSIVQFQDKIYASTNMGLFEKLKTDFFSTKQEN